MANLQLPEYLQFHGQGRATGCLSISSEGKMGAVYLMDGDMVYAQTGAYSGLCAAFLMLTWQNPVVDWRPSLTPPVVQVRQSIDELLFQYAQLEDNGQNNEGSLIELYGMSTSTMDEIKLMDLTQYAITFEVVNTEFKGFVFHLEKASTLIGRREDCDVILPDGSISGHHCKIILEKHCIRVIDLGSTNGTFINDELIDEEMLQPGSAFRIGSVDVQLHLKLNRRLNPAVVTQRQVAAAETPSAKLSPLSTQKLDPKLFKRDTAKVKGPITWKNLSDGAASQAKKTTGSNGSLISKMFGKK